MNTAPLEDVTLATSGDREAFSRLVRRHQNHVCSLALALTTNVAASEEIAQEVFVSAWHGLGELKQPSSFVPWLRQLVRRRAADFQRARYRDNRRTASGDDALAQVADPGQTAEKELLSSEERVALEGALDALESEDRELLLLYYREGHSAKEVASLVGISAAAAHKRIERARTKVRADVLERFSDAAARTAPRGDFAMNVVALLPSTAVTVNVASSTVAGAQAAPVVAKAGFAAKAATLAWGVAQPLAMILWADRYAAREFAGPPGEPKRELVRFRMVYAACVLFWVLLPTGISALPAFEHAPKWLRVGLLLALFAVTLFAIRKLQPVLLRAVAPGPAAREEAARGTTAGRLKMIPYAPSLFAILLLGDFLPEAHLGRVLHHTEGASALLLILGATLGVLVLVPIQQWAVRGLEARLGQRAWVAASLGVLLAVCAGEIAGFAWVLDTCSSLLGG